jgi:Family of unknown function (DUF6152)
MITKPGLLPRWCNLGSGRIVRDCGLGMKKKLRIIVGFVALLFAYCGPICAHHGNSAYDETRPITLKGTVTEFDWANPHTQIYFDVQNEKGRVAHWGCETLSPGRLILAGWNKNSIKEGDRITITLVAAKNGAPVGILQKLVLSDGRQLGIAELSQPQR